jgi:fucose permease
MPAAPGRSPTAIKWLMYLMFMMFAMTTDSVGIIIPDVIKEFHLSMMAAGAFHYANMTAIALAAIFLGYLADKLGRKKTIITGLVLFAPNSKGISCFPKTEHGAVAGVILFFTCAAAALGPLAMGAVSDAFGHPKFGFVLATIFAALLFAGLLVNWMYNPARERLVKLDHSEYHAAGTVEPQNIE